MNAPAWKLRGARERVTLSYTYVPGGGTHVVSRPPHGRAARGTEASDPRRRHQAAHAGPPGDGALRRCWLASAADCPASAGQPAPRAPLAQAVLGSGFRGAPRPTAPGPNEPLDARVAGGGAPGT